MKNKLATYIILFIPVFMFVISVSYFSYSYYKLAENKNSHLEAELYEAIESTESMEGLKKTCSVILSQGIINYGKLLEVNKIIIYLSLVLIIYFLITPFILIRRIKDK